jgi:CDP-glycerol glycerophosphotransferase
MPPRVSVVVPIYNVGEYLVPCLDAVEQQTLDGLEVILVDDGSSDGSEQVADAYAQRNPGWQVLHVPNGGLGRARNLGSDLATGEFLAFLDSDDVVPRDAYDLLYHVLNETGSDLVSGGVLRYDGAHASVSRLHARALKRTQMRTHVRRTPELLYDTTAWNKLYRRSFLAEHGLRFPEGVYYEDIPLTTPAHFLARSVDVLVDPVYWWRERQTANLSITQRRAETKNLEDRLAAVTSVDDFLTGRGETEGKRHHDTKVLRLDIPIFLDVLHEGDDTFRRRFIELAGAYLARVDPDLLRPLPPVRRLAYHLIQRGLLDELLQALEISRDPRRTTNFVRRGLRTYADLPYLDDERLALGLRRHAQPAPADRDRRRQVGRRHVGGRGARLHPPREPADAGVGGAPDPAA